MKFRKPHRLAGFDYSSAASYFLTFNILDRKALLSEIKRESIFEPPVICLKSFGRITEKYILQIENHYSGVTLENYVIMPDHVHLLITVNNSSRPKNGSRSLVAGIIQALKSLITKEVGFKIWQLDFYDTVIDTEDLFLKYDAYIDNNPAVWLDRAGIEPPAPK